MAHSAYSSSSTAIARAAAAGDATQATAHLHQALEIYQRLGMTPDELRVQNRLNSLAAA